MSICGLVGAGIALLLLGLASSALHPSPLLFPFGVQLSHPFHPSFVHSFPNAMMGTSPSAQSASQPSFLLPPANAQGLEMPEMQVGAPISPPAAGVPSALANLPNLGPLAVIGAPESRGPEPSPSTLPTAGQLLGASAWETPPSLLDPTPPPPGPPPLLPGVGQHHPQPGVSSISSTWRSSARYSSRPSRPRRYWQTVTVRFV